MKTPAKYTAAFFALAAALAPIYWLITISLKREIDQFASPPLWFSFTPTLRHYTAIFAHDSFGRYFFNSIIVSTCSTLIALILGLPAAYGLARFPWPRDWSRSISFWILSNRMLPPIITIIPLFLMLRQVHLLNSLIGLILVDVTLNLPFVVWMMRGFIEELPREMEEAAMLDGESRMGVLLRIVLPLVRPGLAATAVFCLIVAWNEFLFALTFTVTDQMKTVPVVISQFSGATSYEQPWGSIMAASMVVTIPLVILVMIFQYRIVAGLTAGAVKG